MNGSHMMVDSILERLLKDLEEKERVFETYKVASGSYLQFRTKSILDFIEFEMHRVIRVPLHQIYSVDSALCELLCNAFFGRTKCWKRENHSNKSAHGYDVDLWPKCKYHFYTGMLCMYACVVMEKLFEGVHDDNMAKLYQENRSIFEQRCINLLNEVFRKNATVALNVLEIDYERIFKMGEKDFFEHSQKLEISCTRRLHAKTCWGGCCRVRTNWNSRAEEASIELMAIAYRAKAMSFLAHNCCQSLVERRWHGRLRLSPTRTLISYLLPGFIYMEFALRKARGPKIKKSILVEEARKITLEDEGHTDYAKKLLPNASQAASSTIIDHDDGSLIAFDASTPESLELKNLMQKPIVDVSPANAKGTKYVMKCAPRFPVREDDLAAIRYTPSPSPIVMERIDQSTVIPEEESADEFPTQLRPTGDICHTKKRRSMLRPIFKFYTTTKAKFVLHVIFRAVYVLLYSWVLVAKPRQRSTKAQMPNYWPELIVALVQLSQLCDSVAAIRAQMPQPHCGHGLDIKSDLERYSRKVKRLRMGFSNWTSDHLFGFYRNLTIIINFVLLATVLVRTSLTEGEVIGFWAIVATFSDLTFHTSFLFAAISMMRFLSVFYFFSVITLMLRKMIGILAKFLLIFVMFWMIFAVCHISMAEEYTIRSNHSLAWSIFQNGAFEIFGEVDDEDKVGSVTGCADLSWQLIWTSNISNVRCLFRSNLIPITVFSYMLIASIMLVNLLTALLSKEYDEVSGSGSAVYWKYENYSLLATYESKLWLPPPLSLLYYSFHVVLASLRLTAFFACVFCTRCTSSIIANNPFYFIPKWLDIIFKAIEELSKATVSFCASLGHQHAGALLYRKTLGDPQTDIVITLFSTYHLQKNNKSPFHVRIRGLLDSNTFDDAATPEERIQQAQILFQNIFAVMVDCISKETAQIKTRADTVMGDFESHLNECTTSLPNLRNRHGEEISRPQVLRCDLQCRSFDLDNEEARFNHSKFERI